MFTFSKCSSHLLSRNVWLCTMYGLDAKQAYGPMAPGFPKLWAISKKYGPLQQWSGPEEKKH